MRLAWVCVTLAALVLAGCVDQEEAARQAELQAKVERQYAMLDTVNALRSAAGVGTLRWDARLTAAAEDHVRDITAQERAWPFGSDGTNPTERAVRWGYPGRLVGEIYAQTAAITIDPVTSWVEDPNWRDTLLDPDASAMGFAWQEHENNTAFWVLTLAEGFTPPSLVQEVGEPLL